MRLAIIISTYYRPDERTPFYLDRTLESIDNQTYDNYEVYVVGDAYLNEEELRGIVGRHPKTKCFNLAYSPERQRYGFGNMKMWCSGGVTAVNTGIAHALNDGYEYICHQAHDDLWETNHLEVINRMLEDKEPIFCCTLSTYGKHILPPYPKDGKVVEYYPIDGGMIASSSCIRYSHTKLRVVDRFYTEGIVSPCDAYLWEQLRNELKATQKVGYLTCTVTCHHDEEGYAMSKNQIR